MSYIVKVLSFLTLVIALLLFEGNLLQIEYAGLLLLLASFVFRTRYSNQRSLLAIEMLIVFFLAGYNPLYLLLLGVTAHDLAYIKLHPWVVILVPIGVYHLAGMWLVAYLFLLAICTYTGYVNHQLQLARSTYLEAYDRERKNRYVLEQTKNRLLTAAREAAHLAEIRERNRIAREIHDSIGHNLAGNLLQLQAARKILAGDPHKSGVLLDKTIKGLAGSVELLRSTVHNIKPRDQLGWPYFAKIIDNFNYCLVNFSHRGDVSQLTPIQVELLASTIKEAMTNTARHSNADSMAIEIDIRDKIIRLYIKDDGSGCDKIKEGMGISGMRERVSNAGGSLTVSSADGFMLVAVLPRNEELRGDENNAEGTYS